MFGLFTRSESTARLQSTNVAQGPLRAKDGFYQTRGLHFGSQLEPNFQKANSCLYPENQIHGLIYLNYIQIVAANKESG